MRFCQAKALVHSILKDEKFDQLSEPVKTFIKERLLATVMGHMLEDIVLLDTKRRYGKVTRRCVLYKGGSGIASNGIEYKNVEEFLKEI